jgi:competence protein ComEC
MFRFEYPDWIPWLAPLISLSAAGCRFSLTMNALSRLCRFSLPAIAVLCGCGYPLPESQPAQTVPSASPVDRSADAPAAARVADAPPIVRAGDDLVVRVLDIGQGDATFITNGGSKVLIDGGPDMRRLGDHLDRLGLNGDTIDVVIISHTHHDHYNGLRELFLSRRRITVRYLFENRDLSPNVTLLQLRDSILARADRRELVYRDTDDPCLNGAPLCTITLRGGARLHVMRPFPGGTSANDRSTPVKLVAPDSSDFTMWFAGDAEREANEWMQRTYSANPGMRADVLKGNHHGSCNGLTRQFLHAVSPDVVTFSLAQGNQYGHVHTQSLALLRAEGIPWLRTDLNGEITFRVSAGGGKGYRVSAERGIESGSGATDRSSTQPACADLPRR